MGDPRLDFHPHSARPHAYASESSLVAARRLTDDDDDEHKYEDVDEDGAVGKIKRRKGRKEEEKDTN